MYMVSITKFPVSKGKEVSERFIEATKKFPPDRTLEKEILRMAAKITGDEVVSIAISEVKEGKFQEVFKRSHEVMMFYSDIEGISFDVQPYLSGVEALPLVGLKMPE
jgi:Tfp pilus assembly ATPase PilU